MIRIHLSMIMLFNKIDLYIQIIIEDSLHIIFEIARHLR